MRVSGCCWGGSAVTRVVSETWGGRRCVWIAPHTRPPRILAGGGAPWLASTTCSCTGSITPGMHAQSPVAAHPYAQRLPDGIGFLKRVARLHHWQLRLLLLLLAAACLCITTPSCLLEHCNVRHWDAACDGQGVTLFRERPCAPTPPGVAHRSPCNTAACPPAAAAAWACLRFFFGGSLVPAPPTAWQGVAWRARGRHRRNDDLAAHLLTAPAERRVAWRTLLCRC